jgi:hypothetical protein
MRSKLLALLVVLALLLGTFSTALAQDMAEPFCGDLAEDDCTLLQESQAAMLEVSSYDTTATYNLMVAGIPGLPADEIEVNVTLDGTFVMDDAALEAAAGFVGLDQQAIVESLAEDAQPIVDLINGMDIDATVSYNLTPEVADLFTAQAGAAIPESAAVGVIMVDGVLYVELSDFAELGAPEGWTGVPVGELVQAQVDAGAFEQAAAQMDPANLDPSMAATMGMQNMLMGTAEQFEQYMTVERAEEDVELADGGTGAVFNTTVDVAGLVAGPEFSEFIMTLADSGAFEGSGLTGADIEANLPMVGMMAPMIFADLVVGNSVTVGVEDMLVYNTSSQFSWDLTGLLQMAAMSGALPPEIDASAPMSFSFTTSVNNSEFDAGQTVEAPADATLIPAESLMGQPASE